VGGGWSWREGVQVFHLLVLFLVFASIVVPWLPVPRGLPATLQISVKAFVDTLTHYHHSLLCALPRPYTLQRSARSLVALMKLRFDFSHKAQIALPELSKIESMSIDWIKKNVKVYSKSSPTTDPSKTSLESPTMSKQSTKLSGRPAKRR